MNSNSKDEETNRNSGGDQDARILFRLKQNLWKVIITTSEQPQIIFCEKSDASSRRSTSASRDMFSAAQTGAGGRAL